MKRIFPKFISAAGHDNGLWPALLLFVVVLVPTVCLLWFMQVAMRNERGATRERLAEAYRASLATAKRRLNDHCDVLSERLAAFATAESPAEGFARCIESRFADTVVIFDPQGHVAYPNSPNPPESEAPEPAPEWVEAGQWERRDRNFPRAAAAYSRIAQESTDPQVAARAWQAQARCLLQSGDTHAAVRVVTEILSAPLYQRALDVHGRLIVPNAQLMALELMANSTTDAFRATAVDLTRRLNDYREPLWAASQRWFLMKELRRLAPEVAIFPTLQAEELSARCLETRVLVPTNDVLASLPDRDVWQLRARDHRAVAFFTPETLARHFEVVLNGPEIADGAIISLLPPGRTDPTALLTLTAGERLPNWILTLALRDQKAIEATSTGQSIVYLWTGILVVTLVGVLTFLTARLIRRQAALARMKNDLVATVSHELKTPLASMRLLIDTLLDGDHTANQTTREYLQLIARENARLSRLIDNFLTFSRLERNCYRWRLETIPATAVVQEAAEAVRDRFDVPGCHFTVDVPKELPAIRADKEALATALINLLDNAFKYSGQIKRIVLKGCVRGDLLVLVVEDNGIGIPPRELRKIFRRYYQVDRRLSGHAAGCGLGLAIVHSIVEAHLGRIDVDSCPGQGTSFTIQLPVVGSPVASTQQAAA